MPGFGALAHSPAQGGCHRPRLARPAARAGSSSRRGPAISSLLLLMGCPGGLMNPNFRPGATSSPAAERRYRGKRAPTASRRAPPVRSTGWGDPGQQARGSLPCRTWAGCPWFGPATPCLIRHCPANSPTSVARPATSADKARHCCCWCTASMRRQRRSRCARCTSYAGPGAPWTDAPANARQPGARHAPLHFLAGKPFSADIHTGYDAMPHPVWLSHGDRGDVEASVASICSLQRGAGSARCSRQAAC